MHKKQVSFTTFAKHILDDFGWFVRFFWVLLDYYCLKQTIQPCAKFHNIIALVLLPLPNSTLSKGLPRWRFQTNLTNIFPKGLKFNHQLVKLHFLASRTCWPIAVATCCVSRRGVFHHICRSFKAWREGWKSDGCFLKWWYPTTMGFPTKNDHFGVFWGYHHFRNHPDRDGRAFRDTPLKFAE